MHKGFILLNCDLGAEEYIVDELNRMSIISNAYLTFGAYDVIAEIETENQEEFEKAVATIRKLTRVVSTMTLSVIDMKK
ncbi:MAG: Lrp/AsnC family transcriptional regulator [Nitrosopumilus sp.]|nr:Lrp/AsnC family transcriptional regulator [Nitrosopumilus sp.]